METTKINIKKYLGRNDLKSIAHYFEVNDSTVQRALSGYESELCKNIRSYALNIAIVRYEQFKKDLPELQAEFEIKEHAV